MPEYVGLVVSAYMAYMGVHKTCTEAYQAFLNDNAAAMSGFLDVSTLKSVRPSVLRYSRFFTYLLQYPIPIGQGLTLTQISLSCNLGQALKRPAAYPYFMIKQGEDVVYTSSATNLSLYVGNTPRLTVLAVLLPKMNFQSIWMLSI